MLKVVQAVQESQSATSVPSGSLLDEIAREGARRMLAAALKAEADAYVDGLVGELDGDGHRLVVRNGHAKPRTVTTAAGAIELRAPRVNDKRIDGHCCVGRVRRSGQWPDDLLEVGCVVRSGGLSVPA